MEEYFDEEDEELEDDFDYDKRLDIFYDNGEYQLEDVSANDNHAFDKFMDLIQYVDNNYPSPMSARAFYETQFNKYNKLPGRNLIGRIYFEDDEHERYVAEINKMPEVIRTLALKYQYEPIILRNATPPFDMFEDVENSDDEPLCSVPVFSDDGNTLLGYRDVPLEEIANSDDEEVDYDKTKKYSVLEWHINETGQIISIDVSDGSEPDLFRRTSIRKKQRELLQEKYTFSYSTLLDHLNEREAWMYSNVLSLEHYFSGDFLINSIWCEICAIEDIRYRDDDTFVRGKKFYDLFFPELKDKVFYDTEAPKQGENFTCLYESYMDDEYKNIVTEWGNRHGLVKLPACADDRTPRKACENVITFNEDADKILEWHLKGKRVYNIDALYKVLKSK